MAEFAYNNVKNASTDHTPFELNCCYYHRISLEKHTNFCSQSKTIDKLLTELQELMSVYRENFYYAQKL